MSLLLNKKPTHYRVPWKLVASFSSAPPHYNMWSVLRHVSHSYALLPRPLWIPLRPTSCNHSPQPTSSCGLMARASHAYHDSHPCVCNSHPNPSRPATGILTRCTSASLIFSVWHVCWYRCGGGVWRSFSLVGTKSFTKYWDLWLWIGPGPPERRAKSLDLTKAWSIGYQLIGGGEGIIPIFDISLCTLLIGGGIHTNYLFQKHIYIFFISLNHFISTEKIIILFFKKKRLIHV